MLPDGPRDVLTNTEARRLLLALDARGIALQVRRGNLATTRADRLTDEDRAALRRHKSDLLVLVLIADVRTLDRLLAVRAGRPFSGGAPNEGACYCCGLPLPASRPAGRCGWCALAARLYAGGPIPADLIDLFPDDIRGAVAAPIPASALPFDAAAPAA